MPFVCDYCEYIYPQKRTNCPFCGSPVYYVDKSVEQLQSEGYSFAPLAGSNQQDRPSAQNGYREPDGGVSSSGTSQSGYYQHLQQTFQNQSQVSGSEHYSSPGSEDNQPPSVGYRVHVTKAEPLTFSHEQHQSEGGEGFFSQFNSPPPQVETPDFSAADDNVYVGQTVPPDNFENVGNPVPISVHRPPRTHTPRTFDWRFWLRLITIVIVVILILGILFNFNFILSSLWGLIISAIPLILMIAFLVWLVRSFFR